MYSINKDGTTVACLTTRYQAPNALRLVRQRPDAAEARRYYLAKKNEALYGAAAKLWRAGVDMPQAISIVREAMSQC